MTEVVEELWGAPTPELDHAADWKIPESFGYQGALRFLGWAAILLLLRPMSWEEPLAQGDLVAVVYARTWLLIAAAGAFAMPLLVLRSRRVPEPVTATW
ncbi:hypothetical protein ABT337_17875 [Saccharopolyspora hirsuta]|uniref:hypothetical protein n=1 Tax=Saccharopolyspora hirsuta TaxID=1837 RepID=UPI003328A318